MVEKRFSRTTQYLAAEIGNWVCGPKNPIFLRCRLRAIAPTLIRSKNRTEGVGPERGGGTTTSLAGQSDLQAVRCVPIRRNSVVTKPDLGRQTLGRNGGSRQRIGKADCFCGGIIRGIAPSPTPSEKAGGSSFSPATFWLHCGEADIGKEGVGETSVGFLSSRHYPAQYPNH